MSPIFDDCKRILIASEMSIMNKYFKEWLAERKVVARTTKSVLLCEIDKFAGDMCDYYEHKPTTGPLLNYYTVENHIDNMLLDMQVDGLNEYCSNVKSIICESETERITLNKFIRSLDEFVENSYRDMIIDANR